MNRISTTNARQLVKSEQFEILMVTPALGTNEISKTFFHCTQKLYPPGGEGATRGRSLRCGQRLEATIRSSVPPRAHPGSDRSHSLKVLLSKQLLTWNVVPFLVQYLAVQMTSPG